MNDNSAADGFPLSQYRTEIVLIPGGIRIIYTPIMITQCTKCSTCFDTHPVMSELPERLCDYCLWDLQVQALLVFARNDAWPALYEKLWLRCVWQGWRLGISIPSEVKDYDSNTRTT